MTSPETTFVDALFWKTLAIGVAAAVIGWVAASSYVAVSIGLGVVVSAFNLRVIGWIGRKLVDSAKAGQTGMARWAVLLAVKLFLLIALTFVFIRLVGAHVLGYLIGYSSFLPAIVWQLIVRKGDDEASIDNGDTESL